MLRFMTSLEGTQLKRLYLVPSSLAHTYATPATADSSIASTGSSSNLFENPSKNRIPTLLALATALCALSTGSSLLIDAGYIPRMSKPE